MFHQQSASSDQAPNSQPMIPNHHHHQQQHHHHLSSEYYPPTHPSSAGSGNNNMNSGATSGGMNGPDDTSKNTLWMGELDPWLDEAAIKSIWASYGETVNVKLIREKFTGTAAGYCFVEFASPAAASKALTLHGQPMPNSQRFFKLNWASGGGLADSNKRDDKSPEYSIFVGDLASEVTEFQLLQLFQYRYPSCKSAKIMTDPQTNASRGYGFVRFTDESEMQRALTEMQGYYCGPRPMRISTATPKAKAPAGGAASGPGSASASGNIAPSASSASGPGLSNIQAPPNSTQTPNGPGYAQNILNHAQSHLSNEMMLSGSNYYPGMNQSNANPISAVSQPNSALLPPQSASSQPLNQFTDPNNTTVFVGGLSSSVTEDDLRRYFAGFGDITYVKIPSGKGCGFVQYVQRSAAEAAITKMQGYPIGNSRVRLSWGRSQNNNPNGNNNNANGANNNNTNAGSKNLEIATSALNPMGVNMSMNMPLNMNLANPGVNMVGPSTNVTNNGGNAIPLPNNLVSQGYLPAPIPPVYPQMAIPPHAMHQQQLQGQQNQQNPQQQLQNQQSAYGPFGAINPQIAHIHPPPSASSDPSTSGGADLPPQVGAGVGPNSASLVNTVAPGQDPSEPVLVARLNQLYLAARDGRLDRVEGDGRGYHGVYAQ